MSYTYFGTGLKNYDFIKNKKSSLQYKIQWKFTKNQGEVNLTAFKLDYIKWSSLSSNECLITKCSLFNVLVNSTQVQKWKIL